MIDNSHPKVQKLFEGIIKMVLENEQPAPICRWDDGWAGMCKSPATTNGFCDEHKDKKCAGCGEEAIRACERTGIQFVCGAPLCATCEHGTPKPGEAGLFMLGGGHAPPANKPQEENAKTTAWSIGIGQSAQASTSMSTAIGYEAKSDLSGMFLPGALCDCGCGKNFDECLKTKYAHLPSEMRDQLIKTRMFAVFNSLSEEDLDRCVKRLFCTLPGESDT